MDCCTQLPSNIVRRSAAQRLLSMLSVQRIISSSKKRGDVSGVILGMYAGLGTAATQQAGCEAIAMLAYQADSMFSWPVLHRMPHGAKYGASGQPNRPRLTGCVEAVFQAMATHQKIGPVQGAGCWALAALATAIPAEGRPDGAGRGGVATLLSVGDEWAGQLSGMEEKANAALHHCTGLPVVMANATALINLLKGEPARSVLLQHPSKGWNFVPAAVAGMGVGSSGAGPAAGIPGEIVAQSPPRSPARGGGLLGGLLGDRSSPAKAVTVGVSSRSSDWRRRPV